MTLPTERIIQFGEGNFLRAFVGCMVQRMNDRASFSTSIVIVKPRPGAGLEPLQAQGCRYHVHTVGLLGGREVDEVERIDCVSRAINPYDDPAAFLALADQPDVRFVVSNTTEAGIAFDPACRLADTPAASYPAKLTQLLWRRFRTFRGDPARGLIILPCELIFAGGRVLRECILRYIELWHDELGSEAEAFRRWFLASCPVCSTLVDRIVPGRPRRDVERLRQRCSFDDPLLVEAEAYHLWVIEAAEGLSTADLARELPAREAGLNVLFVDDETPYHQRKVTLLNGTHTVMAAVGLLAGVTTVRDACLHPRLGPWLRRVMTDELLPTLSAPDGQAGSSEAELRAYAESVWERFLNPCIDHQLESIMLHAVAKYRTRDLPALQWHAAHRGTLPEGLVLGLAAIMQGLPEGDRAEAEAIVREVPGLTQTMHPLLLIHPDDTVAVALRDLTAGQLLLPPSGAASLLALLSDIPAGHKVALRHIAQGEDIIKYGAPIGHALRDIRRGELVDHNNIATNLR